MDFTEFVQELSRGFNAWRTPIQQGASKSELILFFVLLFLVIIIVYLYIKLKKIEADTGSVEKHRRMLINSIKKHLNAFQFRIIQDITEIQGLDDPEKIFQDPFFFEKGIEKFLQYRFESGNISESMDLLCRSVVETYEKIYHYSEISEPLTGMNGLETNRLIFIISSDSKFFIGKIISRSRVFTISMLTGLSSLNSLAPYSEVTCYVWRAGDAHYNFKAMVEAVEGLHVEVAIPETFKRHEDEHHPLVAVNIECSIALPGKMKLENPNEPVRIAGLITNINESEMVMHSSEKLEFNKSYAIEFIMDEHVFQIIAQVIRLREERTDKDTVLYLHNLKMATISPESKNVIRKHINELFARKKAMAKAANEALKKKPGDKR